MTQTATEPHIGATRRAPLSPSATPLSPRDLAPIRARDAIGRDTGIARSRPSEPVPLWRSAGVVGLVALIAAAAIPAAAHLITDPSLVGLVSVTR